MTFDLIKKNYDRGLWDKAMVSMAVGRTITAEQYLEITEEEYIELPETPSEIQEQINDLQKALDTLLGAE